MNPIGESQYISKYLNNDSQLNASKLRQRRFRDIDAFADLLVNAYSTPSYRRWYCRLCYRLGIDRVTAIYKEAKSKRSPGHYFAAVASKEEHQWVQSHES